MCDALLRSHPSVADGEGCEGDLYCKLFLGFLVILVS